MHADIAAALPASVRAVLDTPPAPGDPLDAIEHVVILVQENRGLDHYFGTFRGVRGYGDRSVVLQQSTLRTVFEQPDGRGGVVLPYEVDEQEIIGTPHNWVDGHEAWNDGRMDNWVPAKGRQTMSYYRPHDVPFYHALADAYTICDAYHCSVLGPTVPNRNYIFSGTTGYEVWGARSIENHGDNIGHPGYTWTSYAERLQGAGVSWRVFQEWDNYLCNNLEFYGPIKAVGRKVMIPAGYDEIQTFYVDLAVADEPRRDAMLKLLAEGVDSLSESERELYDRALRRVPAGGLADEFGAAIAGGTLPKVTYLVPSQAECEHPDSGTDAATGAALAERLVDALASHPETYAKTVFLITYDENDGFFDHVPPPVPPPGTPGEEYVDGWPIGLGARVPMTVVSPWSRGGYVCSETFDHTSVVRFLERWTGVEEPNISAWRRSLCGDLTATLGSGSAAAPEPASVERDHGSGDSENGLPAQEPGTRPARALPYQPDAFLDAAGRLVMSNTGSAAFQFAVHANRFRTDGPRRFDVRPGETVSGRLETEGPHDYSVYGPNRFLRRFTADAASRLAVTTAIDSEAIRLTLHNASDVAVTFSVESRSGETRTYEVGTDDSVEDVWQAGRDDDGWYDLAIAVSGDSSWSRHLIGHIENGRDSVTA